jgi:thiamine transport system substrate-binding protein
MNRRQLLLHSGVLSLQLAACVRSASASQALELRVLVHDSFDLPKPLLAQFESQFGAKLVLIKAGDAAQMLNKIILTRAAPLADAVFGLDQALLTTAKQAKVLEDDTARAINYGFVAINYDKQSVSKSGLPLPSSLQDLTEERYRAWLAVPNPATSSPGYAFLLATIAHFGEVNAFAWWSKMRHNGVKITKGWSEAYYTAFSKNGGSQVLTVSYASSPAAEVFYSKEKLSTAPTASLFLPGTVWRQSEVAAVLKNASRPELARAFLDFLLSDPVQRAMQTTMWMYPIAPTTPRAEVLRFAIEPTRHEQLPAELIAERGKEWVQRWTQVVLK